MKLKVAKFGGSSLADARHFTMVKEIVLSDVGRKYVVPSAPGKRNEKDEKITDMLLKCFSLAKEGYAIDREYAKIQKRYENIINELGLDIDLSEEFKKIYNSMQMNASQDYVASRGEYLTAIILSEYLDFDFVPAESCICFNNDGVFLPEKTNQRVQEILKKHPYAIIPGFYGAVPDGRIKTFTRGGSDITGAIVARAVMADVYENWTDVSGIKMADPRYVDHPKTMKTVTYRELRDLSYMGATVLHEDTIFPVRKEGIPIHIRNTNFPAENGSMIIGHRSAQSSEQTLGIAGKKGYVGIKIEKENMRSFPHLYCEICAILGHYQITLSHIMYGVDSLSIVVQEDPFESNRESVIDDICEAFEPDTIFVEDKIALIAVVGSSICENRENVISRICRQLKTHGIDLKLCDMGGSEISIFIGVEEKYFALTQQLLYKEFENQ